jgi:hypothetical protein
MLAVVLLVLIPATNAIQIQTVEKEYSSSLPTWHMMKTMDPEALQTFLQTLVKNDPALSNEFQQQMKEIGKASIASSGKGSYHAVQGKQSANGNQTFLEKIYWKIFNYRLLRFYMSVLIYAYHPSKLTMMRTMTWGIKLLRIIKIGAFLGFIVSNPQPPAQPEINFAQDLVNKTLTVTSVTPTTILWSDIDQIGSGHCDPLPNGTVMVGDELTSCSGFIVLRYVPLNAILGVFEFD